jgi:hypothetical protein
MFQFLDPTRELSLIGDPSVTFQGVPVTRDVLARTYADLQVPRSLCDQKRSRDAAAALNSSDAGAFITFVRDHPDTFRATNIVVSHGEFMRTDLWKELDKLLPKSDKSDKRARDRVRNKVLFALKQAKHNNFFILTFTIKVGRQSKAFHFLRHCYKTHQPVVRDPSETGISSHLFHHAKRAFSGVYPDPGCVGGQGNMVGYAELKAQIQHIIQNAASDSYPLVGSSCARRAIETAREVVKMCACSYPGMPTTITLLPYTREKGVLLANTCSRAITDSSVELSCKDDPSTRQAKASSPSSPQATSPPQLRRRSQSKLSGSGSGSGSGSVSDRAPPATSAPQLSPRSQSKLSGSGSGSGSDRAPPETSPPQLSRRSLSKLSGSGSEHFSFSSAQSRA